MKSLVLILGLMFSNVVTNATPTPSRTANSEFDQLVTALRYYNGEAYAHYYDSGRNPDEFGRRGLYAQERTITLTPTAVRHHFTDATVSTEVVNVAEYKDLRPLFQRVINRGLQSQFRTRIDDLDGTQILRLEGDDYQRQIRDYLMGSLRAQDRRRVGAILSSRDGWFELLQFVAHDTQSEVIGFEAIVIYDGRTNRAIIIRWEYTHS